MEELLHQVDLYKKEIENFISENGDTAESFRIKFLGTKGIVKNLMQEMKNVPNEKKKEFGQILNDFKQTAEAKYEILKQQVSNNKSQPEDSIDYTLPGDPNNYWHKTSVKSGTQSHCFNFQQAWFCVG